MARSFFDTLSAKEKQRIKEKTDALIDMLEEWVSKHSLIHMTRIPSVALLTAAVVPRIALLDSLLLAKLILLIFGIDDMADERVVTLAELQQKAEQWYWIANHGPSSEIDDSNEPTAILLELRAELSKFRLFEPLREYWSSSARRLFEAMAQEYQYGLQYSAGGTRSLPSLDEYLSWGLYSISVPFWVLTVLIVLGEPSVVEHFKPIDEAIKCAGAAIRLFNDLRTFDREQKEGNINAVVITYHAMLDRDTNATEESALSEAKQYVSQLADSYAQRCYDLVGQIQTESRQLEEIISRVVAFNAYFYSEHDYHITSLAEIYKILNDSAPPDESHLVESPSTWSKYYQSAEETHVNSENRT
jgi:hypothetical protein